MNTTGKRLYQYIIKQKKKIALGILATLLMGLVELATGGLLKWLTNLFGKLQGSIFGVGSDLITLPLRFNVKVPILDQKINFIDTVLKGPDQIFGGMVILCFIFLALYLLLALFNYLRRVFMNAATQRILQNFKEDIYNKILKLPFSFFSNNKTGDMVSRITYDVATLTEIIDLLIEVARALVYMVIFIPVMFYISWQLSLFTILFFPLSVLLIDYVTRKIKRVSKSISDNVGDYTAFLEERINRFKLIKSYGKEAEESKTFSRLVDENYGHNLRLIKLKYSMNPTNDFLGMVLLAVVYLFYSYKITHSTTTLGDIVLFLFLVKTAFKPIKKVAEAWGQLHVALVSTRKIFLLLDQPEENQNSSTPDKPLLPIEQIEFNKVSFAYQGDTRTVLNQIKFTVKKGDIIAIKGKSGAGKSTLLNLLPAFYLPISGSIFVNGKPYNSFSLSAIRKAIILVDAPAPLINGTLLENLTYAGNKPTEKSLTTYHQFLGLPESIQWNQFVGKEGINLSQGQQQKLAFLRALLAEPQVLILDEVFSSLDNDDIHFMFEACKNIPLVFMVSRKPEVLQYANRKLLLHNGQIDEI